MEAVDDAQIVEQPCLRALAVVGRYMSYTARVGVGRFSQFRRIVTNARSSLTNDMYFVVVNFCCVQFLREPFELLARVDRIEQRPRIQSCAVVRVETNDSEAGAHFHFVVAAARWTNRGD